MNDEIFEELKSSLSTQERLLKRFYDFCIEYFNFEFDELGINADEAENIKRKALKIKDKIIQEINNSKNYKIIDNSANIFENKVKLILQYNINESKKTVKFEIFVEKESFTVEIIE